MSRCRTWMVAGAALVATAAHAAPWTVTAVDSAGKPLADAVVAVLVKGAHTMAPAGASAQMAQKDRQFAPQLLVVQTGTAVSFPNQDAVRHHVYSFSPTRNFELKLYAGTPAAPVVFDKPGIAVLGCNIHDRMKAWIAVVDTPVYARTDASGNATLELPEGEHRLLGWHAQAADATTWAEVPLKTTATTGRYTFVLVTAGAH